MYCSKVKIKYSPPFLCTVFKGKMRLISLGIEKKIFLRNNNNLKHILLHRNLARCKASALLYQIQGFAVCSLIILQYTKYRLLLETYVPILVSFDENGKTMITNLFIRHKGIRRGKEKQSILYCSVSQELV